MNLNILQSGYNGCKSSLSCFHNSIIPRRLKTSFGKFLNLHLLWIFSHPQNGLCWRKFSGNVSSMSHLRISSLNPYQIIFALMCTDPLTLLSASAKMFFWAWSDITKYFNISSNIKQKMYIIYKLFFLKSHFLHRLHALKSKRFISYFLVLFDP